MTERTAGAGLGPADEDPDLSHDMIADMDVDPEDEPDDVRKGPIQDDVGDTDKAEVPVPVEGEEGEG
jgi:hypothetical protein